MSKRPSLHELGAALLFFTAVSLFILYPASLQPNRFVIGRTFEDAFESIWYLDWYARALFELGVSPFFQPNIFYPHGWDLRFAVMTPFYPLLLSPITAVVGAVPLYNILLLLTLIIPALGTYTLARYLNASPVSSLFAGLAFALLPQRTVMLGGHLNLLLGSSWLPWLLLLLLYAPQAKRRTLIMGLAGLTVALALGGSWHFIFFVPFLMLGPILFGLLPAIWQDWRGWLGPLTTAVLIPSLTVGPFLIMALFAQQTLGISSGLTFYDINITSVSLERFLVPSGINPLFWTFARETFPLVGTNSLATFGLSTLLLALLARPAAQPAAHRALRLTLFIGLLFMLGTTLHVNNRPLTLPVETIPAVIQTHFPELLVNGRLALPMPFFLLHKYLPFFDSHYHFGRWAMVAMLALAPLAALGLDRLQGWVMQRVGVGQIGRFLPLAFLLILLVEFNTQPQPAVTPLALMHRDLDRWLAEQPRSLIVEYPFEHTMKPHSLYFETIHQQPMLHGSSLLSEEIRQTTSGLRDWRDPATITQLQQLNVRYLILNSALYLMTPEEIALLQSDPRLTLITTYDDPPPPIETLYLFEIEPAP